MKSNSQAIPIITPTTIQPSALPKITETQIFRTPLETTRIPQILNHSTDFPEITPSIIPILASDLLFLSDHRLYRWDRLTHYGVILAENVLEFTASASENLVVMLRSKDVAANGVELYDLEVLDFTSMQVHPISVNLPRVDSISLSSNGRWLVYHENESNGKVVVIDISSPSEKIILGKCSGSENNRCKSLRWSPDNIELIWLDHSGIWLGDIALGTSSLINPGIVQIIDPAGQLLELEASFYSPRWSPVGRYVLVEVSPKDTHVKWQAVLDVRNSKLNKVVDTYSTGAKEACVAWLPNGSLLAAHSGEPDRKTNPVIKSWDIMPTNSELLTLQKSIQINLVDNMANLPPEIDPNFDIEDVNLTWLQPVGIDRVLVGFQSVDGSWNTPILLVDLSDDSFQLIAMAGVDVNWIKWFPDDSGFLISDLSGNILYFDISSSKTSDILPGREIDPLSLYWMLPEIRK